MWHVAVTLSVAMLCHYAECHYAECHYAECQYAECHYAECYYAECSILLKKYKISNNSTPTKGRKNKHIWNPQNIKYFFMFI